MIKRYLIQIFIICISLLNFVKGDMLDTAFSPSLDNTVVKETSPQTYTQNITSTAIKIVVALGVVMFIYGGVSFIMALGDEGKVKKQKQNLIMTAIGLILALGSVAIVVLINSVTNASISI